MMPDNAEPMLSKLRGTLSLHTVELWSCPTSYLVGLSSVPQIKEIRVKYPYWNLDVAGREAAKALRGVRITFILSSVRYNWDEKSHEFGGFWDALPFAKLGVGR
jgi:hypothetical protein